MAAFLFLVGLGSLIAGAELLVRGASALARAVGISPLVVGLTVVAFGTSSPEFAVSLKASFSGQPNIVVGNVIGSNIFNVLFVLGLSALIAPLVVSQQLIRFDVPLMIGVSVVVLLLAIDGGFGRIDGLLLFSGLVCYIALLFYWGRSPDCEVAASGVNERTVHWAISLSKVVVGLGMLVAGSNLLVDSSVAIALYFGVSELIIGLTIIAAGTSLPEVVTSVVACIRGERDIAIGNVVGSNLFNLLGVLGVAALLSPSGVEVIPSVVRFDLPIVVVVALVCLPIFFTGGMIFRWEGALLLGYYIAYTAYLILAATEHDALPVFSGAMLYFVIPLTALTLFVVCLNAVRRKRAVDRRAKTS